MLPIRFFMLLLLAILSGCANLKTISRTNILGAAGTAIHLDAQQRVILSKANMDKICAEPSPDAMNAYAASLALGISTPEGGGSLAGGQQNSAAAIGLRTQSITLMRDVLYRICEASMNGMVGPVYNATLLGRGMDLTTVVLAVEQLTGAVKAEQAILTGATDASASTMLHEDFKVLEQAIASRDKHQSELIEAKSNLAAKKQEVGTQQSVFDTIKAQRDTEQKAGEVKADTQQKFQAEEQKLIQLKSEQAQLAQKIVDEKDLIQAAQNDIEAIKKVRKATLTEMNTNAAAKTTTTGQFGKNARIKTLHDNSQINIDKIAGTVDKIVQAALHKDYTKEACLALIGLEKVASQDQKRCDDILVLKQTEENRKIKEEDRKIIELKLLHR